MPLCPRLRTATRVSFVGCCIDSRDTRLVVE